MFQSVVVLKNLDYYFSSSGSSYKCVGNNVDVNHNLVCVSACF